MRLLLKIKPLFKLKYCEFNNYWIQGLIYRLILGSEFDKHDENKFKWFNFSNIFPKTDFKLNEEKDLIISSPNKDFIYYLKEQLENKEKIVFGNKFEALIKEIKLIKPKENLYTWWKTETPIILDIGKEVEMKHLYWTPYLKDKGLASFRYFLKRLTENSLKKIRYYFNLEDDEFKKLEEKIYFVFSRYKFLKSVTTFLEKDGLKIRMAGTLWELLPFELLKRKYLYLLYETGLGEKNSLGFGFVNIKTKK